MKKISFITFCLLIFLIYLIFPQPVSAIFNKNINNPILIRGLIGDWDSVLVNSEAVVFDGVNYSMYYTGFDGIKGQIGQASSTNGINWMKNSINPILSPVPGDSWELEVGEPTILKNGANYSMWFTSFRFPGTENYRIGHATSTNGLNWNRTAGFVLQKSSLPWEAKGVANPSVINSGGTYYMWYAANDMSGIWRIGLAYSTDGVNWTKNTYPVLFPTLSWEGTAVAQPSVIIQDNLFHMYYHAGPIVPHYIGHAVSSDGVNWIKDNDPILSRGGFGAFDASLIAQPDVIRVWNKLKLFYSGRNTASQWSIGLAEEKVPVPYFAQDDPAWGTDIYDNADKWANLNSHTMSSLGCAVTSAAMVLKHFNVQKTPGNPTASPNPLPAKNLNPGTLNEWLKSRNDGTFRNGSTNWALIASMTKLSNELDPTSPKLEYFASPSASLNTVLGNELPAILRLPYPPSPTNSHFVVAKEIDGATYKINDPYYEDRTTLAPHYNTISRVGYYQPTNSDFSYLVLVADPDVTLTLKDSNNQVVGEEVFEEPIFDQLNQQPSGASAIKLLALKSLASGNYTLEITSSSDQPYQLDIYFYDSNGNGGVSTFNGTIGPAVPNFWHITLDKQDANNASFDNVTVKLLFDSLITDIKNLYTKGEISNHGIYNSLLKKATNAENAVKENDTDEASDLLTALLNELSAQRDKFVSEVAYKTLTEDAELILQLL